MSFIAREIGIFLKAARQPAIWENWSKAKAKYADAREAGLQLLVAQLVPDYAATVYPQLPYEDLGAFKDYCSKASAVEIDSLYEILTEPASFWLNHKADNSISAYVLELFKLTDEIFEERERCTPKHEIFRFVAGGGKHYAVQGSVPAGSSPDRSLVLAILQGRFEWFRMNATQRPAGELLWLIKHCESFCDLAAVCTSSFESFYTWLLGATLPAIDKYFRVSYQKGTVRQACQWRSTSEGEIIIDLGEILFGDRSEIEVNLHFEVAVSEKEYGFLSLQQKTFSVVLAAMEKSALNPLNDISATYAGECKTFKVAISYQSCFIRVTKTSIPTVNIRRASDLTSVHQVVFPLKIHGFSEKTVKTLGPVAINIEQPGFEFRQIAVESSMQVTSKLYVTLPHEGKRTSRQTIHLAIGDYKFETNLDLVIDLPVLVVDESVKDKLRIFEIDKRHGKFEVRINDHVTQIGFGPEIEVPPPKDLSGVVNVAVFFDGVEMLKFADAFKDIRSDAYRKAEGKRADIDHRLALMNKWLWIVSAHIGFLSVFGKVGSRAGDAIYVIGILTVVIGWIIQRLSFLGLIDNLIALFFYVLFFVFLGLAAYLGIIGFFIGYALLLFIFFRYLRE